MGVALLPKYLFENTSLVRLEAEPILRREVWLQMKQSTTQLGYMRTVIDDIRKIFEENQHLLVDE